MTRSIDVLEGGAGGPFYPDFKPEDGRLVPNDSDPPFKINDRHNVVFKRIEVSGDMVIFLARWINGNVIGDDFEFGMNKDSDIPIFTGMTISENGKS